MTKKPVKGWCEVSIEAPVFILEAIADFLSSLGAGGAVFSETSPPKQGFERLTGFLACDDELEQKLTKLKNYIHQLRQLFPEQEISRLEIQTIIEQDWLNAWKESVVPAKISDKFWVVPEWREVPNEAKHSGAMIIRMEPGLAFGTGYHPTTQICLKFMEKLVPEQAQTLLDFGTGTGILAIAGAMLGAKTVLAVDIDPLALKVAEDNIKRNNLLGKIQLLHAGADTKKRLSEKNFDLIVANLFYSELKRLRDYLVWHLKKGGFLVISGILKDQAKDIHSHYKRIGLSILEVREEQGWVGSLMKKS